MKTNKRIRVLAEDTRLGHRASAHQEFRAVVAANGYEMSRGGWVKFGDENVCRGWEALAGLVLDGSIVLREPAAIMDPLGAVVETAEAAAETAEEHGFPYPTRGLLPEVDEILDRRRAAALAETASEILAAAANPERPEVTYFYTTRTQTIPLSDLTSVTTVIVDEALAETEGECESGAALNCEGRGFRRVLPESMLGGGVPEQVIQCVPCYEASAAAYARKAHRYGDEA